ncbi:uncharacterized protein GGS22DRAFT_25516 [Annulohypoxylon maeteangense]|uniref:uncharacterized protein n=1 Tax=Annulohypoxylon maeteangense TaxID=1927788 RepID=UPI002008CD0A|nr:uncharacterized protein GGS22DRAFT_25516 [Annulohypoxylon maeteangense]KAI0883759.1 hypothetical protein GGS22DRAFT_25516 [Annulohypoxylon maeteangense]
MNVGNHNVPNGVAQNPTASTIGVAGLESWKMAYEQHHENLVTLVSPRWAAVDFFIRLFGHAAPIERSKLGYRVNFAEMQRMYLRALQIDLINIGVDLKFGETLENAGQWNDTRTPGSLEKMDKMLKTYIQAVRDYEYMTDATRKKYDIFIASSERNQDDVHLEAAMMNASRGVDDFKAIDQELALPTGPWEVVPIDGKPIPIAGTRNAGVQNLLRRALVTRLFLALLGSAFLIGPMWLLALERDLIFDLGTTTVAVTIFGLFLAFVVDKGDQVFAGTLAYAAVLMVFVGVIIQIQETPSM